MIDRFSEDIDLAVNFSTGRITTGERKKLKKMIAELIERLGMKLLNPLDVRSRRDHNEYYVGYDHAFQTDENTVDHMIIETIVAYRPYPIKTIMTSHFIAKYLEMIRRIDLIDRYDLSPFLMRVQAIERTFIDKLFAIGDYHLQKRYSRHSRHIYDIHKIWTSNMIDKKVVTDILEEVIKDRQLYGHLNLSCQPGMNPQKVLKDVFSCKSYEEDYKSITSTFIYAPVEYEACMSTLKSIVDEGILPVKIKKY